MGGSSRCRWRAQEGESGGECGAGRAMHGAGCGLMWRVVLLGGKVEVV